MSLSQRALPPLDGSRTVLPGLVDFNAENNPDSLFAAWPSSDAGTTGISFSELADATHRIAHLLRPGRQGQEGEVVAIVIHTDTILHCALFAGCVRAGLVVSLF